MAIAYVQKVNGTTIVASTIAGTIGTTTTGNALIVCSIVGNNVSITGIAVSVGSAAFAVVKKGTYISGAGIVEIWAASNITGGAADAITVTYSGAPGAGAEFVAYEFSGMASSTTSDGTNAGTGSSTTPTSGTIATTNANDLIIGAIGLGGTPQSGEAAWTVFQTGSGNYTEYIIESTTQASIAATATQTGSNGWSAVVAALEASGGGVIDLSTTLPMVPETILSFTPQLALKPTVALLPDTVLAFTPTLGLQPTISILPQTILSFTPTLGLQPTIGMLPQSVLSFTPTLALQPTIAFAPDSVLSFTGTILTGLVTTIPIAVDSVLSFTPQLLVGLTPTASYLPGTVSSFTPTLTEPDVLPATPSAVLALTATLSEPTSAGLLPGTLLSFAPTLSEPSTFPVTLDSVLSFTP